VPQGAGPFGPEWLRQDFGLSGLRCQWLGFRASSCAPNARSRGWCFALAAHEWILSGPPLRGAALW